MCKKNKQLLFLGGFPSGGTDLLKNVLNSHPEVHINGEMPFLYKLAAVGYTEDSKIRSEIEYKKFIATLKKLNEWNNLENIDFTPENYPININDLLYRVFTYRDSRIWGNKTPQNTENIKDLFRVFPSAKFIIIIRDVRDVCLSWRKKWGKNILLCAHKWNKRMIKINEYEDSEKVLVIKFEDLLSNTKKTTLRITDFLNIDYSENMLDYEKHITNKIDGKINYGETIKKDNYNKWGNQLNKKEIKRIESIAFNTLNYFHYTPLLAKKSKKLSIFKRYICILQEIYSTLFVGNRNSEKNTLKERVRFLLFEIKKKLKLF